MFVIGRTADPRISSFPLWEGDPPNYKESGEVMKSDTTNIVRLSLVQLPDIAVFLPSKSNATGEAVVICPGGGYRILAYDWEGSDIARWFSSRGIAAMVLKYRLPVSKSNIIPHETPLMDAQRAFRMVRYHAGAWNIDPGKIGIMGFSAGGHLASTLSTHFDGGDPVPYRSGGKNELPSGFFHSGLSSDLLYRGVQAFGIQDGPAGRGSGPGPYQILF